MDLYCCVYCLQTALQTALRATLQTALQTALQTTSPVVYSCKQSSIGLQPLYSTIFIELSMLSSLIDLAAYQQITPDFSFNIFELLGGGAYGRVYRGYDHRYKKSIAVKHITLKTLRAIKSSYEREIQILEQLKHKNIIEYYGSFGGLNNSEGLFLFFELCEKGTLADYMAKKKLTEAETIQIFKQLVQGMTYVNSKQIFHRDIKPQNLLLNDKNQLKIADFGTAKEAEQNQTSTYRRCTPVYAAPEVYLFDVFEQAGKRYSEKCDVFSAGYILYELLTGEQLTRGINNEQDLSTFLKKCKTSGMKLDHPALTQRWIQLLKKMMAFDPNERPTFAQIRSQINGFSSVSHSLPKDRDFNEQQKNYSETMVLLIRLTLQSQERKYNYYVNILKVFDSTKYVVSWVFPKISKTLLIFYSLMCYIKQAEDGLNFLNEPQKLWVGEMELKTVFGKLVGNAKGQILKFIESKANNLNKSVEQIRSLLQRQVIPQIELLMAHGGTIQKALLLQLNIQKQLKNYRERDYSTIKNYLKLIKQCLNSCYQSDADLQVLSQADLKAYLNVTLVAFIDETVGANPSENTKWPSSYLQIEGMSKRELIQEICRQRNYKM